jgi:hypothetical protein
MLLAVAVVVLVVLLALLFGRGGAIFSPSTTSVAITPPSSTTIPSPPGALGEFSGELAFTVMPGSSETLQFVIVNGGGIAINATVGLGGPLKPTGAGTNATAPSVTFNPGSVTILPYSTQSVDVSVFVPYTGNINGTTWSSTLYARCTSGCSAGVAKIISIEVT